MEKNNKKTYKINNINYIVKPTIQNMSKIKTYSLDELDKMLEEERKRKKKMDKMTKCCNIL